MVATVSVGVAVWSPAVRRGSHGRLGDDGHVALRGWRDHWEIDIGCGRDRHVASRRRWQLRLQPRLLPGAGHDVRVATQPAKPAQVCSVSRGGTVMAKVTDIAVQPDSGSAPPARCATGWRPRRCCCARCHEGAATAVKTLERPPHTPRSIDRAGLRSSRR